MLKEIESCLTDQEEADQIYRDTISTNYTKYPNKYIDKIRPKLKKCEASICDFVIRKTYGFHKAVAEITLDDFTKNCIKPGTDKGYGQRNIIKAKNELLKMGLLIKIRNPKGQAHKGLYAINIFYDNPKPEAITKEPIATEIIPEIAEPIYVPVENPVHNTVENYIPEAPESLNLQSEIQEQIIESEQGDSSVQQENNLQKKSDPNSAHIIDTKNSIYNAKNTNKTKNWKSVCFSFAKIFSIAEDKVYKPFANLVNQYGLDYVENKIQIVKEFAKSHKIENPIGLLVSACKRDYIPPRPVRQKLEIKARTESAVQKSREAFDRMLETAAENEKRQTLIDQIKSKLEPGAFDRYVERARQKFANLPFVMDLAVQAEANDLLLADFS